MTIVQTISTHWIEYSNDEIRNTIISTPWGESYYNPHKLHFSLTYIKEQYQAFLEAVSPLLRNALEKKIIKGYKFLKHECFDIEKRAANLPLILYLHDEYDEDNLRQVASFCNILQFNARALKLTPGNNKEYAICDLLLTNFLFYRLSARKGYIEYVSATHPVLANLLAAEGEVSNHYRFLKGQFALAAAAKVIVQSSSTLYGPASSSSKAKRVVKPYVDREKIKELRIDRLKHPSKEKKTHRAPMNRVF